MLKVSPLTTTLFSVSLELQIFLGNLQISQMLKVSPLRTTLFSVSWELQIVLGFSQSWQWMPSVCWGWSGGQNRTPPKHRNFLGRSSVWQAAPFCDCWSVWSLIYLWLSLLPDFHSKTGYLHLSLQYLEAALHTSSVSAYWRNVEELVPYCPACLHNLNQHPTKGRRS